MGFNRIGARLVRQYLKLKTAKFVCLMALSIHGPGLDGLQWDARLEEIKDVSR